MLNVTFIDGTPIDPDATYVGLTVDFLLQGGDDFGKVIPSIYTPRNNKTHGIIRNSLEGSLKEWGDIEENTLIDPKHPRLIII